MLRFRFALLVLLCKGSQAIDDYGVDISFPMHHENVSINYDYLPHNILPSLYPTPDALQEMPIQPLGDRQAAYHEYMQGCTEKYKDASWKCWDCEQGRIAMSLRQPQSMINYTKTVRRRICIENIQESFFAIYYILYILYHPTCTHSPLFVF
jgi:hypothetical protein